MIDLSHWDYDYPPRRLVEMTEKHKFFYLKASEGISEVDNTATLWYNDIKKASEGRAQIGFYHVLSPDNGEAQFLHFTQTLLHLPQAQLVSCIDIENEVWSEPGATEALQRMVSLHGNPRRLLLYCSESDRQEIQRLHPYCPLWIADYGLRPTGLGGDPQVAAWQWTSAGEFGCDESLVFRPALLEVLR